MRWSARLYNFPVLPRTQPNRHRPFLPALGYSLCLPPAGCQDRPARQTRFLRARFRPGRYRAAEWLPCQADILWHSCPAQRCSPAHPLPGRGNQWNTFHPPFSPGPVRPEWLLPPPFPPQGLPPSTKDGWGPHRHRSFPHPPPSRSPGEAEFRIPPPSALPARATIPPKWPSPDSCPHRRARLSRCLRYRSRHKHPELSHSRKRCARLRPGRHTSSFLCAAMLPRPFPQRRHHQVGIKVFRAFCAIYNRPGIKTGGQRRADVFQNGGLVHHIHARHHRAGRIINFLWAMPA